MLKAFLTIKELAGRWAVSARTVRREVARGRLKRHLIGGQVRFALVEVERYERLAT